jgi:hypothetical protein
MDSGAGRHANRNQTLNLKKREEEMHSAYCFKVKMVDLVGIEPTTSSMPWKRAPSCATGPRLGRNRSNDFRPPVGDSQTSSRNDKVLTLPLP